MDIVNKFALVKENNTYRRVDEDYHVNVFLGYNESGCMSMVITEYGKLAKVTSTKVIEVSLKRRADNRLALTFDLLEDSYRSMFLVFCKDVIVTCENAGNEMAITSALTRWRYWKEMFTGVRKTILDVNEIKGLIGELLYLKLFFIPYYGEEKAISSWRGPLLGHKDFEIDDTWHEVKSISENAIQVTISSLEQLDSSVDGHLIIMRLEPTSSVNSLSVNLNKLVSSIMLDIKDQQCLALFKTRLDNAGYSYNTDYDNYSFVFKCKESYKVDSTFPRLSRSHVNKAIGNAKYTILLNAVSIYREAGL